MPIVVNVWGGCEALGGSMLIRVCCLNLFATTYLLLVEHGGCVMVSMIKLACLVLGYLAVSHFCVFGITWICLVIEREGRGDS